MLLNVGTSMLLDVGILRLLDLATCRYQWQHVAANSNRKYCLSLVRRLGERLLERLPEGCRHERGDRTASVELMPAMQWDGPKAGPLGAFKTHEVVP